MKKKILLLLAWSVTTKKLSSSFLSRQSQFYEKIFLTEEYIGHSYKKSWDFEKDFEKIIGGIATKAGLKCKIPTVLNYLIVRYFIPVYSSFEELNRLGKIQGVYNRSFVSEHIKKERILRDNVDARKLKLVSFFKYNVPKLEVCIRNLNYTSIVFDGCNIGCLKVKCGNLKKVVIKNSKINKVSFNDLIAWRSFCFKNVKINELIISLQKHKGSTLRDRSIIFNTIQIVKKFKFNTKHIKSPFFYRHYKLVARDAELGPSCKVTISPNVKILSCSKFINSPMFLYAFSTDNNTTSCCYECLACLDGYCRLNAEIFNESVCESYSYKMPYKKCRVLVRPKGKVDSFLRCCLPPVVCSLCLVSCPVLCWVFGLPKIIKDSVQDCCCSPY